MAYNSIALYFLLVFSSLAQHVRTTKTGPLHEKVVVCYISTWAVYRPGLGSYSIDAFDPTLCTHAVYAFAGLDIENSAIKSLDPWQDLAEDFGKGGYQRVTALKEKHPHLKVTLAIGGWNEGSQNYSILAADSIKREKFVQQVTNFVRKYKFDGLDLDWEYPTQRGGQPEDRENFVQLVKELRQEFNMYNLLLTSAIGGVKTLIDQAYDILQLSRYLDFLHIMCYDYHGNWDHVIGFNAPLRGKSDDVITVQYTIDYLLKMGAPASKLVLGLPFYGRTFRTTVNGNIGDAALPEAFNGPFTQETGFLGYNEICSMLKRNSSSWTQKWDNIASEVIAHSERNSTDGSMRVVTFDNSRSIANKVLFAMERKLAGVMIWSVDTDDFRGDCDTPLDTFEDYKYLDRKPSLHFNNYTLLRTINKATLLALEAINNGYNDDNVEDNEIPHGDTNEIKKSAGIMTHNSIYITGITFLLSFFFTHIQIKAVEISY